MKLCKDNLQTHWLLSVTGSKKFHNVDTWSVTDIFCARLILSRTTLELMLKPGSRLKHFFSVALSKPAATTVATKRDATMLHLSRRFRWRCGAKTPSRNKFCATPDSCLSDAAMNTSTGYISSICFSLWRKVVTSGLNDGQQNGWCPC